MTEHNPLRKRNLILQDNQKNHNKFYDMRQVSDTEFEVAYGRIGRKPVVHRYPLYKWSEKYQEKIKKGYHDISDFPIRIGSVVKTRDHTLGIVIEIEKYWNNKPERVKVLTEHKGTYSASIDELSHGYINPDFFTHSIFYPNLVQKYKEIKRGRT